MSLLNTPADNASPVMTSETPILMLPGYGGSGPEHWQTLWQQAHPHIRRVEQRDWEHPSREEWVGALEAAAQASGPGTVLVAHSLACLQVVHWAAATQRTVRAALLVGVPDPTSAVYPPVAADFGPVPLHRLPFPSLLVGSTNDPYATIAFTETCAKAWGSQFVSVGAAGHINAASGIGAWPEGMELLDRLLRP